MSFYHHVYFYPVTPNNPDNQQALITLCNTYLADIPGLTHYFLGQPAGTDRAVVDNDYIVALFLEFPDGETEKAYQAHPQHLQFIAESRPLWSHVRVYDSNSL